MRRDDTRHMPVIGSDPIVIGQACEFDCSGNQSIGVAQKEYHSSTRPLRRS